MLEEKIKNYLKNNLSTRRYEHTLGVEKSALELAKINGADLYKVKIAALAHDLAKEISIEGQRQALKLHNAKIDEISNLTPQILHGFVSAIMLKDMFKVNDKEILNAVAYHSTGRKNMSLIEKIIYIADYIEPNRNYDGVEGLRNVTKENLNKGVLMGLNNTIKLLVERNGVIHPDTVDARNYLVVNLKSE